MDLHAIEYYSAYIGEGSLGHFHRVIPLHEDQSLGWSEVKRMAPKMCRGWYELARLPVKDRIEFTRDFWLAKLPYYPASSEAITSFFSSVDDLGIFLTQKWDNEPFEAHQVYSLANNSGFFHGKPPASDGEINLLQKEFSDFILPPDYLSFLQIHNGFAKLTDTGMTSSDKMKIGYEAFQKMIAERDEPVTMNTGSEVNPASLIPFYESFGMPFFQCFWKDWYPDQEMGNVYYSAMTRKILTSERRDEGAETMAFQSFTDWLLFYLEKID